MDLIKASKSEVFAIPNNFEIPRVYPRKRASKVACVILVMEAMMIALPPRHPSFTLAPYGPEFLFFL
jgi:hypothetical protein